MVANESKPPDMRLTEHIQKLPDVHLQMDPTAAFGLLLTIQLGMRHPEKHGRLATYMRPLADVLIEALAAGDPEIEAFLRRGDDLRFDC